MNKMYTTVLLLGLSLSSYSQLQVPSDMIRFSEDRGIDYDPATNSMFYNGYNNGQVVKLGDLDGNGWFKGKFGVGSNENPEEALDVDGRIKIKRGSGGTTNFLMNLHDPRIWSTKNTSGSYPFGNSDLGHLVLQPRTSSNRDIIFITGNGNDIRMVVKGNGNVGIGTTNPGSYKLAVNGTIKTKEVIVTTQGWSDHVFKPDYSLKPLHEVEKYIKKHNHLEGIPSEKEVREKGVNVGEIQAKLLEKIEELTLHIVEQNKKIRKLEEKVNEMEMKN